MAILRELNSNQTGSRGRSASCHVKNKFADIDRNINEIKLKKNPGLPKIQKSYSKSISILVYD